MTKQEQVTCWQSVSDEWRASGESQKQFCQRKGINYGQFVTWRSKILSSQGKSRKQLQPVRVTPSSITPPPKSISSSNAHDVAIHLCLPNGIKMSVTYGTPISTIKDLLNCLGFVS